MLRHLSSRVWATSDICKVSQVLSKLLIFDTNSRGYHGQGIDYDEDSMFDEGKSRGRPNYRNTRARFSDMEDYDNDERKSRGRPNYRNTRARFSDFEDDYDEQDLQNKSNYRNVKPNFSDSRQRYPDFNYRKNNHFQDRNTFGDNTAFRRNRYPTEFNNSFGRDLVRPIYDSLPPVEKDFYVEHSDVTQRSLEEAESYRKSLNISVRGSDVPNPITRFDELSMPELLKNVIIQQEYSEPTAIQAQGWPIALSGRDMVGISQTGSGKTLVFILPAIIHAMNQTNSKAEKNACKPQVLVLAPTRELVQQIMDVSNRFSSSCHLKSAASYGGASKMLQLQSLRGAHICVATPGRLIDFVSEGSVSLEHCTYLVLDEADRMLDMGFEPQIRKIVEQIRPDRQTLMWSATWPREIQSLAEDFLNNYVQVTVGAGELVANPNIQQNIHIVKEHEKEERIISLLKEVAAEEGNKVLVFAQTKRTVDYLGRYLNSLGIPVLCIHGDVSQSRRDYVLNSFRSEKSCVLIATDVAARGLDISDIRCVVNYDFPTNIEDYIHRIGRTARGAASGVAHSFFTSENAGITKDLISVLKQANQSINPNLHSMTEFNRSKGKNPFFPRGNNNFQRRHFSY